MTMLFTRSTPVSILVCSRCKGTGAIGLRTCPECTGMCAGMMDGSTFAYFSEPFTRYHIALRRARRVLDHLRVIGAIVFGIGFFALFAWQVYAEGIFSQLFFRIFWVGGGSVLPTVFWLSVFSFSYLLYRVMAAAVSVGYDGERKKRKKKRERNADMVPQIPQTWEDVRRISKKERRDIAKIFTDTARHALEDAYKRADADGCQSVDILHLFLALVGDRSVSLMFLRLGISPKLVLAKAAGFVKKRPGTRDMPLLGNDVHQAVFQAYLEAQAHHEPVVQAADLLAATVRQSPAVQEILYDLSVEEKKLENVIAWERMRARLRRDYRRFREASAHHNKYGLDKAMTAVATPFLNAFSRDITMMAVYGYLSPCVGRDMELDEIMRIIEGGRQSVLLTGDHGVGKMSIIHGIAARMIEGNVPERLYDKRLVELSPSQLLAGVSVSGAQERLIRIVREIKRAGNIIVYINNIHELMAVADGQGKGMDVAETLAEYVSDGKLLLFATATSEGYNKNILHSELGTVFTRVEIKEMDEAGAMEVLESKAGAVEYEQNIFFSYDALFASVQLAKKFLRETYLPESAIGLLTEVASFARNARGPNQIVGKEDVAVVVGQKTGVPVTSISDEESVKLLHLEKEMHTRVIGQDEAVSLVANALRRARAEVRSKTKPIASFLFLGPTGVGKTELAKTIASVYFGGEDRMVRLDMSEFQEKSAVSRLIGEPEKQGTGRLTEAVRQHPFSLVLLDELEKADADVLNIFLQVFDDGRLTDSTGRVVDFTSSIIIATSNAGTAFVQKEIANGVAQDDIRQALIHGELKEYYHPEFLNRFDAIVLFRSLSRPDIKQVADRMLRRIGSDLEARGVALRVEDAGIEALADAGFDPEFGARPMRRAIQDMIENTLAEMILTGALERGDTVVVGDGAKVRVEKRK